MHGRERQLLRLRLSLFSKGQGRNGQESRGRVTPSATCHLPEDKEVCVNKCPPGNLRAPITPPPCADLLRGACALTHSVADLTTRRPLAQRFPSPSPDSPCADLLRGTHSSCADRLRRLPASTFCADPVR